MCFSNILPFVWQRTDVEISSVYCYPPNLSAYCLQNDGYALENTASLSFGLAVMFQVGANEVKVVKAKIPGKYRIAFAAVAAVFGDTKFQGLKENR